MKRRLGTSDIVLLVLLAGLLVVVGYALLAPIRIHPWRPTFSTAVGRNVVTLSRYAIALPSSDRNGWREQNALDRRH